MGVYELREVVRGYSEQGASREPTNSTVHPNPFQLGEDVGVSAGITPPPKFPFCLLLFTASSLLS